MKTVLMSIHPKWCELIASGKKTVEVRKNRPKLDTPFKVYIYCTKDKHGWFDFLKKARLDGKVIGEFVCDYIMRHCEMANADIAEQQSRVKREKILEYANGKEVYGWHISNLVIYDKPKELSEFRKYLQFFDGIKTSELEEEGVTGIRLKRPPQSWCYVEGGVQK